MSLSKRWTRERSNPERWELTWKKHFQSSSWWKEEERMIYWWGITHEKNDEYLIREVVITLLVEYILLEIDLTDLSFRTMPSDRASPVESPRLKISKKAGSSIIFSNVGIESTIVVVRNFSWEAWSLPFKVEKEVESVKGNNGGYTVRQMWPTKQLTNRLTNQLTNQYSRL